MSKYIDSIKKKQPGLTAVDYDIINREAILEIDKSINNSQKSLSLVKEKLELLKSSRPFKPIAIACLIHTEKAIVDELSTLNSVKAEQF